MVLSKAVLTAGMAPAPVLGRERCAQCAASWAREHLEQRAHSHSVAAGRQISLARLATVCILAHVSSIQVSTKHHQVSRPKKQKLHV
jgi:hypothetical protein